MAATETGHRAAREVDELYREHGPDVYRYAYAVLGNHADAEDVTQTTFLNAYRALEQGVRPRKPSNWLLTIASNAIKQRFRQEQTRPRLVELDERIAGHESEADGPSVGELLTALSKIPPQQRQAIVLREFEGRSYAEIAEILGVTTTALETLLFRARRSLSEELAHQLTCTEAQLAVSKAADGRLGRKERRRLRDHLGECPDCAQFARIQQRHRTALRGLVLLPIPLSLSILKGLDTPGTATAATVPTVPVVGTGVAAGTTGVGVGAGAGTGGGFLATGVAIKAAAAIVAVTVAAGAAVTEALQITQNTEAKAEVSASRRASDSAKVKAAAGAAALRTSARPGSTTTAHSPAATRTSATPFEESTTHAPSTTAGVSPPTAAPEQTGTSGSASPNTTASTPAQPTSQPQGTTTTTTKTAATPKRAKKGKRVAGAKRVNATKRATPKAAAATPTGGGSTTSSGGGNGPTQSSGSPGGSSSGSGKTGGSKP